MKGEFPLITIATVTYNAQATLQRTIDSVACQTYRHIEHLIIDGCSSDGTFLLVQRYVERNSHENIPHQINVVREPDKGLYDAMNKALQNATGDYIVFLNAGDCLHDSTTIGKLVEKIDWLKGDAHNPAIVYGETDIVDNEGRFLRHRRLQAPKRLGWQSFASGMLVCHQSFYVRMDLARSEKYNLKYRFSADFDWCIRLLKRAARRRLPVLNTNMILTDYLSEGMTTRNHRASLKERFRLMTIHYGWTTAVVQHLWFVLRSVIRR
ncbi:MAG: glycosyltransferase [Bacteroidaceae bacterium]|jgi:glycosyltransferase involved in cell wall biosynthesis|nr:glycosyltransferase [Bacteroidaceae bacterium]MBQ2073675.1 glycosyltransferase [Bacteroidaceae bacterium]